MKLFRLIKRNIPNTITCLNLFSGSLACVFAFRFNECFGALHGYEVAFILIGLAAIFDFCDGLSARLLHAYSALGKELDSLSDLVSFGLAPAMLAYNLMAAHDAGWVAFSAFLIPVFGALRLAKFNIDDRQSTTFIGLPIPANAIFWIGAVAWNAEHYAGTAAVAAIAIAFPLLMVCKLRMFSLKIKSFAWKQNARRYVLLAGTAVFLVLLHVPGFACSILLYLLLAATGKRRDEQF